MPAKDLLLDVLVIEDNEGDFILLEDLLTETGLPIGRIHRVERLSEGKELLSGLRVDLVFLDLSLPDSSGLDSYLGLSLAAQRIPVILLTGLADTSIALQALLKGAQDYLIKGEFDEKLLSRAIRYSIERKRNMENLRESEERYRELFNSNPMPMWVFDRETFFFLEVNAAAILHYGYSYQEFISLRIPDIFPPGESLQYMKLVKGEPAAASWQLVWRHKKKDGEFIFVEIDSHFMDYKGKSAVLALANDVTEKRRLQEELNEQRVSRQRQITEAVIEAQEKERTEIGKELHDNVNQILGATNLYIHTAISDESLRQELLERSSGAINEAINEIRKISKSLITPGFKEVGLVESIEDIIEDFRMAKHTGIRLEADRCSEESIDDRRQLTVFRIIQEQLNNIIKHAGPCEVLIRLTIEGENIVLSIADNGKGFDTSRHRKGVGLTNIMSRVELLNGKVDVFSKPGEGCRLWLTIPRG